MLEIVILIYFIYLIFSHIFSIAELQSQIISQVVKRGGVAIRPSYACLKS